MLNITLYLVWKNTHKVNVNTCKYTHLFTEASCPGASELLQLKWAGFRQGQWHPSVGSSQDQVGFVATLLSLHSEIATLNALAAYWIFCGISPKISIASISIDSYDLTNFPLKQNGFLEFPSTHFMLHIAGQLASHHWAATEIHPIELHVNANRSLFTYSLLLTQFPS